MREPAFPSGLRRLRAHDVILLVTPAGTARYRVESTRVVSPRRTEVLAPSRKPTLAFVTCCPFDFVPPRGSS